MALLRTILLLLCIGLLGSVTIMYLGTTQMVHGYETISIFKTSLLHKVWLWSLFGILVWCVIFARSEPRFVRISLIAILLALVVMHLAPKIH